jgi:hypothetical protein
MAHGLVVVASYGEISQIRQPTRAVVRVGVIANRISQVQNGIHLQVPETALHFSESLFVGVHVAQYGNSHWALM